MNLRVRSLCMAAALLLAAAGRGLAAEVDLTLLPYADDHAPRQAYLRREKPVFRVRVTSHGPEWTGGEGRLSIMGDGHVLRTTMFVVRVLAGATTEIAIPFPLGEYRAGEYRLVARFPTSTGVATASAPLWVCPEPDPASASVPALGSASTSGGGGGSEGGGLPMSIWWERPASDPKALDDFLDHLHARGLSGVTVTSPSPLLLDRCLWHQVPCTTITHGDAAGAGFTAPEASLYRLNARDQTSPVPWRPELDDHKTPGLANIDWQLAAAHNLGTQVAALTKYPAYDPRVLTDDDYYTRSGPDYNPWNLRRYRQIHGTAPPRPAQLLLPQAPRLLDGPTGIIPDDDPWLRWMTFLSRDVLGHYDRLLTGEVLGATNGKGKIGPISGPMFLPLVDVASAQWPPYNFGAAGFNLICSYDYNFYRVPALTQVWWQELGRMNNRDAEAWLMPDCLDRRTVYHLQNWYLAMASGVDGLCYFVNERCSDAAAKALAMLGPLDRDYGKLLARLRPAPRNVALLMPFEQACYDLDYPGNAGYAFDNLAMAHLEVEPAWPEELEDMPRGYRVVLLHALTRLTQNNLATLEHLARRGTLLVADAATTVPVPGARKLGFTLGGHDRTKDYDDADRIAQARAALLPLAEPWGDSDDRHLLLRHVQAGGVDYLWVVHLMDHDEDLARRLKDPAGPIPPVVDAHADEGLETRVYNSVVNVPPGPFAVYDVFKGQRLQTHPLGGRLEVPVRMGTWQGTLLAFYPAAPDALKIKAAHKIDAGKSLDVRVYISAAGRYAAGYLPLSVTVTDPFGNASREYSHTALAYRGEYRFYLNVARNDQPGIWHVTVRELSTGLAQDAEVYVRAGL